MKYQTCTRIKPDGVRCGSPAIRGTRYCYYHIEDRARKSRLHQAFRVRERALLAGPTKAQLKAADLTDLRTPEDISLALTDLVSAIWLGQIDTRSAGQIIHAINLISKERFRGPSTSLRISPAGSDARKAAQVSRFKFQEDRADEASAPPPHRACVLGTPAVLPHEKASTSSPARRDSPEQPDERSEEGG